MSVDEPARYSPLDDELALRAQRAMKVILFIAVSTGAIVLAWIAREHLWHIILMAFLSLLLVGLVTVLISMSLEFFRGP